MNKTLQHKALRGWKHRTGRSGGGGGVSVVAAVERASRRKLLSIQFCKQTLSQGPKTMVFLMKCGGKEVPDGNRTTWMLGG